MQIKLRTIQVLFLRCVGVMIGSFNDGSLHLVGQGGRHGLGHRPTHLQSSAHGLSHKQTLIQIPVGFIFFIFQLEKKFCVFGGPSVGEPLETRAQHGGNT